MLNFTNLTLKLLRTPVKLKTGLEILTKKKKKPKSKKFLSLSFLQRNSLSQAFPRKRIAFWSTERQASRETKQNQIKIYRALALVSSLCIKAKQKKIKKGKRNV